MMIELRCSRDLALRLGAFAPDSADHHRQLTRSGQVMLVRDRETGWAMFWPMVPEDGGKLTSAIKRLIGKSS